tara:strand:+ start:150 stop:671 length:522 start_codon:yes stop_codon:yes gene_type:complete
MAGSLIKIAEDLVTSAKATVTLTGIDSTYDVYKVVASNIKSASDDKDLYMRVTVSGTAQTTSNYDEATKNLRTDTTFSNSAIPNLDRWQPFSALGNSAGENGNLVCYLFNFNNASEYSFCTRESVYTPYDIGLFGMQGGGVYTVAEAHDGIEFTLESSTNFSSGNFTLYGLKK